MDEFIQDIIDRFNFAYEVTESQEPINCDDHLMCATWESADDLELSWKLMPSRAGHDAQVFFHCPMGMIFVPSQGGISHSPVGNTHRRINVIMVCAYLLKPFGGQTHYEQTRTRQTKWGSLHQW